MNWANILKQICLYIDSIVYTIVEFSYKIFNTAAQLSLKDTGTILDTLVSRIMTLVTIFMLFRLVVILIEYLTNPDRMNEKYNKNTYAGNIITTVFVTVAMLVLVYSNFIFGLLHDFQLLIFYNSSISTAEFQVLDDFGFELKDTDVIRNVIFGKTSTIENFGRTISVEVLSSFLYMDYDEDSIPPWGRTKTESGDEIGLCTKVGLGDNEKIFCNIATNPQKYTFSRLDDLNVANQNFHYYPILSTLAGGFIAYSLFNATIYIFVRMFQMFFLEILSPIAVVANIDPSKGKGVFKKYAELYIQTFLDLFMRIALVYLTIVFIQEGMLKIFASDGILRGDVISGFMPSNTLLSMPKLGQANILVSGIDFSVLLLKAFSLTAVFYFLQKAPDLFYDVLGMKNRQNQKDLFGATVRSAVGLGTGVVTGIVTPLVKHGAPGALISPVKGIWEGIKGLQAGYKSSGYKDFSGKMHSTFGGEYTAARAGFNNRMKKSLGGASSGTSEGGAPIGGTASPGGPVPTGGAGSGGASGTSGGSTTSSTRPVSSGSTGPVGGTSSTGSGGTGGTGSSTAFGSTTVPGSSGGASGPFTSGSGQGSNQIPNHSNNLTPSDTASSPGNEFMGSPGNNYEEYIKNLEAKIEKESLNIKLLNEVDRKANETYATVVGQTQDDARTGGVVEEFTWQTGKGEWLSRQLHSDETSENKEIKEIIEEYKNNGNDNIDATNGLYYALEKHTKEYEEAQTELNTALELAQAQGEEIERTARTTQAIKEAEDNRAAAEEVTEAQMEAFNRALQNQEEAQRQKEEAETRARQSQIETEEANRLREEAEDVARQAQIEADDEKKAREAIEEELEDLK